MEEKIFDIKEYKIELESIKSGEKEFDKKIKRLDNPKKNDAKLKINPFSHNYHCKTVKKTQMKLIIILIIQI